MAAQSGTIRFLSLTLGVPKLIEPHSAAEKQDPGPIPPGTAQGSTERNRAAQSSRRFESIPRATRCGGTELGTPAPPPCRPVCAALRFEGVEVR